MTEDAWAHEFVLASQERSLGRTAELLANVRSGRLVPVSRGVYRHARARTSDPQRQPDDDYLATIRAAQLRSDRQLTIAGMSAAAVWDLPVVGAWPNRVIVASPREDGGRSNSHLRRSYVGYPPPSVDRGGLNVTTLARTVADVARVETMERAVAIADAALRGQAAGPGRAARPPVQLASVVTELERLHGAPGVARARGILSFADGKSGSAGESCSRVGMFRLRLPAPVLQQVFYDADGLIGIVDFWWPHLRLVGEFDGLGKYLREEFAAGRSVAQIVMDEKAREDRLRALQLKVARWDWTVASNLRALESKLRGAGLRPR